MSKVPAELKYVKSHEWVKKQADGTLLVGITDHAQGALGDLVFVEVPKPGRKVAAGEACAVVESVKAASDVYAPIAGEVIEGNPALANAPETLNSDPYGAGWMWKLKPANAADVDALLDAAGYQKVLETLK
ncbi:MAG: glycine cleavage system protein GcvH [Pseudomonadota bacterium]